MVSRMSLPCGVRDRIPSSTCSIWSCVSAFLTSVSETVSRLFRSAISQAFLSSEIACRAEPVSLAAKAEQSGMTSSLSISGLRAFSVRCLSICWSSVAS